MKSQWNHKLNHNEITNEIPPNKITMKSQWSQNNHNDITMKAHKKLQWNHNDIKNRNDITMTSQNKSQWHHNEIAMTSQWNHNGITNEITLKSHFLKEKCNHHEITKKNEITMKSKTQSQWNHN